MVDPTAPQTTPTFNVPIAPQVAPQAAPVASPVASVKKHSGFDNVLGFLGDFLLSRLNMGTPYRDARANEKLNAARLLDAQDPTHSYTNVGNIDANLAAKLQGQAADDARLAAAQAGTQEARDARLAAQREAIRTNVKNRAASYFNSLASDPNNIEDRYASGRALWTNSAAVKADPDLAAELNDLYPETFNPSMITSSIGASVPVSTQWAQRLTKERIDNQDEQAGARIGATVRGQDIRSSDTRRGQDIRSGDAAANRAAANARTAARIAARPAPAPRAPKPTAADLQYLRANPGLRDKFDGRFGVGMAKRVLGN